MTTPDFDGAIRGNFQPSVGHEGTGGRQSGRGGGSMPGKIEGEQEAAACCSGRFQERAARKLQRHIQSSLAVRRNRLAAVSNQFWPCKTGSMERGASASASTPRQPTGR